MNAARKQPPPEITDPVARRVNDWLAVFNSRGLAAIISGLVVIASIAAAGYLGPAYRTKLDAEAALATDTRQALASLLANEERLRREYADHEAEHVRATFALKEEITQTNAILQRAEAAMAPIPAQRLEQQKILEQIRDKINTQKTERRLDGGETDKTSQVDRPSFAPGFGK